jgi:hypothetical protein
MAKRKVDTVTEAVAFAAMLQANMSLASIAAVLGRSEAWAMREQRRSDREVVAPAPEPAPPAVVLVEAPARKPDPAPPRRPAPPPEVRPRPVPRPQRSRPAARPAPSVRPASPAAPHLRPLTPERLRYARWFLDARWTHEATAELFDLDVDALRAAA